MKAISFKLSGKTAIFKKPDVNGTYFTYNNIHKVALLGILGSIIGLSGYSNQYNRNTNATEKSQYPEFYEKLKDLKVSIVPQNRGIFSKKIQVFNNGVGYASFELGGNLIVKEQWLENPAWDIFILDNGSDEYTKIKNYLENNKSEFIPYLGKNDHFANIDNVLEVTLSNPDEEYIDSLFIASTVNIGIDFKDDTMYMFKEVSPIRLAKQYNFYEYENLMLTNLEIKNIDEMLDVYTYNEKTLAFI